VTTDLSKREKLARALAKAIHEYKGYANWNDVDNLKQVRLDGEWDMFVLVDAFLAELREPDEGMLEAGAISPTCTGTVLPEHKEQVEEEVRQQWKQNKMAARKAWQAMLDEVK